jgi:hypothetical protein
MVAAGTTGTLALGIAAPAVVHHEVKPIFVEAVAEAMPEFNAPTIEIRAAEVYHGPHSHLPHTEGLVYQYINFSSPIVVTGGVPTRTR